MKRVILTAAIIEAFAGVFLSGRYDDAKPTPNFHRDAWALYASDEKAAMVIAPRDHAKSTGLTFDYILAETLFRRSQYVILIGSTEEKAAEQLSNIREELASNEDLRKEFGIVGFETEQKTDIIVLHEDGYRFRILARGAEQKIRGAMWNGMRPDLIVCDDMEDDEQVENKDRRAKFRRWFFRAAKPALSKRGRMRVHGTILHDDSLLSRLRKNSAWKHLFYKAHESYNDFSNLLWPERWTEADLRSRQKEFEDDNDAPGYSQEFLNTPLDNNEQYLRREDFLPMTDSDFDQLDGVKNDCGVDFAISKQDAANRSAFVIGGVTPDNRALVHDVHWERLQTLELVEKFFEIQQRHDIQTFWVEDGQIWLSISPILYNEMQRRGIWINCQPLKSVKDKGVRGRAFQKRHRAGNVRFNKRAAWYYGYEAELLKFSAHSDALQDDQFDGTSILFRGLEKVGDMEPEDFKTPEELEDEIMAKRSRSDTHRSSITGY